MRPWTEAPARTSLVIGHWASPNVPRIGVTVSYKIFNCLGGLLIFAHRITSNVTLFLTTGNSPFMLDKIRRAQDSTGSGTALEMHARRPGIPSFRWN